MRALKFMDDKITLRIDSILKHIDEVLEDTKEATLLDYKNSRLLLKSTCFSICQIGEQMTKIEEIMKNKYPELPWKSARGMRNFIIHDYNSVDVEQIYTTVKNDLPILRTMFERIKKEISI